MLRVPFSSLALLLLSSSAFSDVDLCANPITGSTTWSGGEVYYAQGCHVQVPAGATLTIPAGAIVKLGGQVGGAPAAPGNVAFVVDGELIVTGSAGSPVVFTSMQDDTIGGDTNSDGGASTPGPAQWRGLLVRDTASIDLEHFAIRHGASTVFAHGYGYGEAHVDVADASVRLVHGVIESGETRGVYFRSAGVAPTIMDVRIADHRQPSSDRAKRGDAIEHTSINLDATYADLVLENNDVNAIVIDRFNETLSQDVTLPPQTYYPDCGFTLCILNVPDDRTLTLEPGVSFDMRSVFGITVNSGGTLLAEGTSMAPIRFYSSEVEAQTGNRWQGLRAQHGSTIRFAHCEIAHSFDSNSGRGGLEIQTSDATVSQCTIRDNANDGLTLYANYQEDVSGVVLEDLTLAGNGRHGLNAYAAAATLLDFSLTGAAFDNNGGSAFYAYNGGSGARVDAHLVDATVTDNGADGAHSENRRHAFSLNGNDNSFRFDRLTFTHNDQNAIDWYCNGNLSGSELAATGNGVDAMIIRGCDVYGGREWGLGDFGMPIHVAGNVIIKTGAFLNLAPGTRLQFGAGRQIYASNSTLFALGTPAAPIVFAGLGEGPAFWEGISQFGATSSLYLRNCEISDARRAFWARYLADASMLQNCYLHDNQDAAYGEIASAVVRANHIEGNLSGVTAAGGAQIDARLNFWGSSTGPFHATTNPEGVGDPVTDNVLYDPWLDEPPEQDSAVGGLVVVTGAPDLVSPGQTAEFSVQYVNLDSTTITNALAVLQMPVATEFISATHGGSYWRERHQVVWQLGDLAPGASGRMSAELRFAWGLPRDYRDSSITIVSADNYLSDEITSIDRPAYEALDDNPVAGRTDVPIGDILADGRFTGAYNQAISEGYGFISAADVTREDGSLVRVVVLVAAPAQATRLLSLRDGDLYRFDITAEYFQATGPTGGTHRMDLATGAQSDGGDWATDGLAKGPSGCTSEQCRRNCRWQLVGIEYLKSKAKRVVAWTALAIFTGGGGVPGAVYEFGSIALDYHACSVKCVADPQEHCCTAGQVKWTGGAVSRTLNGCMKWTCNTVTGNWKPFGVIYCAQSNERCVASVDGIGCTPCRERAIRASSAKALQLALAETPEGEACKATRGDPRCKDLELLVAKDPNDITGPLGDLLPGQTVDYTIRYENVGEGNAFGVYIVNDLPAEFDENTLSINDGGIYSADLRQLAWLIGELGPQGDPTSEGSVSYSATLHGGLASSTVIANQATVFFPSVPEETPTNTWVNQIQPVAAIPQTLTTEYQMPIAITLDGRDVSALPLTFSIAEEPVLGTLSGTPPNVTYEPAPGAVGADGFLFTVNNGVETSRPAQVLINVTSDGDTDAPQILTALPEMDAEGVSHSSTPLFTDDLGDVFGPLIILSVNEPLDATTIDAGAITLAADGHTVTITATWDAVMNQIAVYLREPLMTATTYEVSVSGSITDLAGNPLGASTWSLTTVTEAIFANGFEE